METQNSQIHNEGIIRSYFISEFEKDLEKQGVDTVCFMGYGYSLDDVQVGAEFYFSYLYYGRMAALRSGTVEDCLRAVLLYEDDGNINFFDRYKVIQKYKYFNCKIIDHENRKVIPTKERREYVKIKNLRTGEIKILHEDNIRYANLFCWTTTWK